MILTGVHGMLFVVDITDAEPIIIQGENNGYWFDTFNDSLGMESINHVVVNESRGDVTLDGYWNNFDTEITGPLQYWTYEYGGYSMKHDARPDPYEAGQCLYFDRNDNLAAFDTARLWKDFDTYYELLEFDLTPWSIDGPNRQGFFYIEFYDSGASEIHEVRYYWDDTRSGTPANTAALTAIDLGWVLPTGGGPFGDVKFYLNENISEDIDANGLADLSTILSNTVKVRYGFYSDCGPNWSQFEQVRIDNLGMHPPNNTGNFTSVEITVPNDFRWDSIIINKTEPGTDNTIEIAIVDGVTFNVINGLSNLSGKIIDISSISPVDHPSIRLMAYFKGNGSSTPVLHDLNVTWIDILEIPKGFTVSNPLNGYSLILSWNSNSEENLDYYKIYYSLDNISYSWLANVPAPTISFIHYGLTIGVTYYYKIAAVDIYSLSTPNSTDVNGTPDIDSDLDGIGNIPDPDADNDGILDTSDLYPLNPLNDIEIKIDDIQIRVIDIQTILAGLNLSDLANIIDLFNQSISSKIDKLDNIMDNLTLNFSEMMSYLLGMNSSLSTDIQNLLSVITNDILGVMDGLRILEANLTSQHVGLNDTLDILRNLIQSEHTMTRSEILHELNNSLALLTNIDNNVTTHDIEIKNLINALDNLIQNENNLTRDQLMDNTTDILNRLQVLDQDIINEIDWLNSSLSDQLTDLLNNITSDNKALRDWLDIVLGVLDTNLTLTKESLKNQLDILNATVNQFYNDLDSDLGNILFSLVQHDDDTGENHSDIISRLENLLTGGESRTMSLTNLKAMLTSLAGNLSSHNQSIANDIFDVVNDIDSFENDTQEKMNDISRTLDDLAKLEDILSDLKALDQSLTDVNEDLKESIEDKSKEEEIEDRIMWLEMLIMIIIILLIVNLIMTTVLGLRKKSGGGENADGERIQRERNTPSSTMDQHRPEDEVSDTVPSQDNSADYDFPPPPAPPPTE
jgi:hypothetical protein